MKRKKENEMPEQGKEQEQVSGQEVTGSGDNGNQNVQPEMYIDFDTDGMHVIVEVGEAELDFLLNREEIKGLMHDMEQWIGMTQGEGQSESGANA